VSVGTPVVHTVNDPTCWKGNVVEAALVIDTVGLLAPHVDAASAADGAADIAAVTPNAETSTPTAARPREAKKLRLTY
jgi:hypothetical protein